MRIEFCFSTSKVIFKRITNALTCRSSFWGLPPIANLLVFMTASDRFVQCIRVLDVWEIKASTDNIFDQSFHNMSGDSLEHEMFGVDPKLSSRSRMLWTCFYSPGMLHFFRKRNHVPVRDTFQYRCQSKFPSAVALAVIRPSCTSYWLPMIISFRIRFQPNC